MVPAARPVSPTGTWLGMFCDAVLEGSWLAAVVMVPLVFNPSAMVVFEPEKAGLMRTLALVMAVAWIGKAIDERTAAPLDLSIGSRISGLLRRPVALPVAAVLVSYIIATLFSVTPHASLMGSYTRSMGTYTLVSLMVIFAAIAANLRQRQQVERVISASILASVPVSLYALMQGYNLDPLPWSGGESERVFSTLGNPIFLAGYLIMVIPLTAMRLSQAFVCLREKRCVPAGAKLSLHAAIAALQLLAIWHSGSRGPALGLLVGLVLWSSLLLAPGRPKLTLGILGSAAVAAGLLLLVNLPVGPLQPLRQSSSLSRVTHILDAQDSSSKLRLLIWTGVVNLVRPHQPLVYPDGRTDPLNPVRPLIGYGPEGIYEAFAPFIPPSLATAKGAAVWDRTHNETLAALVTTGAFGLLAYLAFLGAVLYHGLNWAFPLQGRARVTRIACMLAGAIATTLALILWRGLPYAGLGPPLGLVGGVFLDIALSRLLARPIQIAVDPWSRLTVISLLAAVTAHFVETQFGFPVVATWLMLWVYVGLMLAIAGGVVGEAAVAGASDSISSNEADSSDGGLAPSGWPVLVTTLCMTAVSYGFLLRGGWPAALPLLVLLLSTALAGAGLLCSSFAEVRVVLAGLGWCVVFAVCLVSVVIRSQLVSGDAASDVIGRAALEGNTYAGLAAWALLFIGAAALAAQRHGAGPSRVRLGVMTAGFGIALVGAYALNVQPVVADTIAKTANAFSAAGTWPATIQILREASNRVPSEDEYHVDLGEAFVQASTTADDADAERLLQAGLAELTLTQRLNPLDPLNTVNLGKLWQQWAVSDPDEPAWAARLDRAENYFAQAFAMSPNGLELRADWADFEQLSAAARFDHRDYGGGLIALARWREIDPASADDGSIGYVIDQRVAIPAELSDENAERRTDFVGALNRYAAAALDQPADGQGNRSARIVIEAAQTVLESWDAESSATSR